MDRDLAVLAAAAEHEREARRTKAREMLRSESFADLISMVDAMAREPGSRGREEDAVLSGSAWRFAARSLKRRHKRLRDRGRHLRHMSAAERHKLRIAAKKQRYAAELFAPLFKKSRGKKYAKALARVQSALGEMNDVAGMPAQLEGLLAKEGGDAALARAAGLVLGYYQARADGREERLRKAWHRFKAVEKFWGGASIV
ncbi:MAG: CHAD domain-containing protein [Acidobacteriia bacterium]|nr:CHAD domain-containing protein [Terriglobia bacterium]